jgi:hypothetical protein
MLKEFNSRHSMGGSEESQEVGLEGLQNEAAFERVEQGSFEAGDRVDQVLACRAREPGLEVLVSWVPRNPSRPPPQPSVLPLASLKARDPVKFCEYVERTLRP